MDLLCPNCQKRLTLGEQYAGQVVRCPMCNGMFQAPALPGAVAPPPAAPAPAPSAPMETPSPPSPALAPGMPDVPPLPMREPPPEAAEIPTLPQGSYTKSWTFHLRGDVLVWITPVCLTLVLLLSPFGWYYLNELWLTLWDLAFSQSSKGVFTFYVIVTFFVALPLSIYVLCVEQRWAPLPSQVRPFWAWRSLFVGSAAALPFVFFVGAYVSAFFETFGNPTTIAMKLGFRLHLIAVLACLAQLWLEFRRTGNKPLPKMEVHF